MVYKLLSIHREREREREREGGPRGRGGEMVKTPTENIMVWLAHLPLLRAEINLSSLNKVL